MEERFKAWGLPICLLMVAYGVGGVWLVYDRERLFSSLLAVLPPAIVGLFGAVYLIAELRRQPDEPSTNPLPSVLGIYGAAWNRLWRTPWILRLFACVALVTVISATANGVLGILAYSRRFPGPSNYDPSANSLYRIVYSGFSLAQRGSLRSVLPTCGLTFAGLQCILFALILLVSAFWIDKRLSALAESPESSPAVTFAKALIYPAAVFCAVYLVAQSVELYRAWAEMLAATSPAQALPGALHSAANMMQPGGTSAQVGYPSGTFGGVRHIARDQWMSISQVVNQIFYVLANGAIIAGLVGGLQRMQSRDAGPGRFFTDSVRYFKPMLGIYAASALASCVLYLFALLSPMTRRFVFLLPLSWAGIAFQILLPFLLILVVFAPFAVVVHQCGTWQAMKNSAKFWARNLRQAALFMAVGYVLITLPMMVFEGAGSFLRRPSWLSIPTYALIGAAWVMCHAFVILALWEFYTGTTVSDSTTSNAAQVEI